MAARIAAGVGAVGTALAGTAAAVPADTATENMNWHGIASDIPALHAEVPVTYKTPDQRLRELMRELGGEVQDLAQAVAKGRQHREEAEAIEKLGNALRKPDKEEYRDTEQT